MKPASFSMSVPVLPIRLSIRYAINLALRSTNLSRWVIFDSASCIAKGASAGIVEGSFGAVEKGGVSEPAEGDVSHVLVRGRDLSDAGASTADRGWTGALLRENEAEDDATIGGRQEEAEDSTRMNAWQVLGVYGEMQVSESVIDTYR